MAYQSQQSCILSSIPDNHPITTLLRRSYGDWQCGLIRRTTPHYPALRKRKRVKTMPWLINDHGMKVLTKGYEILKCIKVDTWFYSEALLEVYWDIKDWPFEPDLCTMRCVPIAEGHVAWIVLATIQENARIWTVWGYSHALDTDVMTVEAATVPHKDKPDKRLLDPDIFFNRWMAEKIAEIPAEPARSGDRCACRLRDTPGGKIALVADVTPSGWIKSVQTDVAGTIEPATRYARKWFVLRERDQAFDARWHRGATEFPAYIAMLGSLAREQKKLTGTPRPRAKPPEPDRQAVRDVAAAGAGKPAGLPLTAIQLDREAYRQAMCADTGQRMDLAEAMSHMRHMLPHDHPTYRPYEFYEAWRNGVDR